MNQKGYVVFNPVAGTVDPDSAYRRIGEHLDAAGWTYEIYQTTGDESVPAIVREALSQKEYDLLVAAGGDGTVSAVAGGLINSDVPMGLLPTGSGNALARELQIPLQIQGALDLLTGEHARRTIDGMQVGDHYFFLSVSVGLSSLVMKETGREQKRNFGWLAYIWTGLRKLLGHQPGHFWVTIDGKTEHWNAAEVNVANSGAIGMPAFQWGPDIRIDDGRLDVCVVRARNLLDYLRVAGSIVVGRQRPTPHIHCKQAEESVDVQGDRAFPIQADGEIIGHTEVRVELLPQALTMIVPA